MRHATVAFCWFTAVGLFLVASGCGGGAGEGENAASAGTEKDPASAAIEPAPESGSEEPKPKPKKKSPAAPKLTGDPITESPQPVPLDLLSDGWIALFDGETLFGWNKNSDANWSVVDGAITVDGGEKGLLTTGLPFANYELRLEFQADKETNSGIFLRTPAKPAAPEKDCYELNIAPSDNPFPTGSLVGRKKVEGVEWKEGWRAYTVVVRDRSVTVSLDGEQLLEYEDPAPLKKGFIGLQLNQGKVAFRRIFLRPLNRKPLFNGVNLDGWTAPESESVFTVTDAGDLNVKNGRGHLESTSRYADFVLQLECISHAKNLNSGLFFRCIPDSIMDGYESQIHNGFENGDRRLPMDHGTGGIFRRQKARLVVADDEKWFYKTIVVDGPTMAVWVNGYQVSHWTDDRKPDANPRRGLRLEEGSLMIQGHDPTTDLSFRNLYISEQ